MVKCHIHGIINEYNYVLSVFEHIYVLYLRSFLGSSDTHNNHKGSGRSMPAVTTGWDGPVCPAGAALTARGGATRQGQRPR